MTPAEAALCALADVDASLPTWAWDTVLERMRRASEACAGGALRSVGPFAPTGPGLLVLARRVVAGVLADLGRGRLERVMAPT